MEPSTLTFDVRWPVEGVAIVDVDGDVTPAAEGALMEAYSQASGGGARGVILDFTDLGYMNSGGIGLLVTLLVRAQRAKQGLAAFGLSDHYRQILGLTRIDEAIAIHDDEASAVAHVSGQ
jgi:anti-sigma B factor antagonist